MASKGIKSVSILEETDATSGQKGSGLPWGHGTGASIKAIDYEIRKEHVEKSLASEKQSDCKDGHEESSFSSGVYSISTSDEIDQEAKGNIAVPEAEASSSLPGPSPKQPNPYSSHKSTPLPTGTVEADSDDEYADWDPTTFVFSSTRNIKCFDAKTTLQGLPHLKGTICPHSNSEGSCFRGDRCRHEHHIDQKKLDANPRLALPYEPHRISHLAMLPPKIEGQKGACFFAKVTCVNSINDFYITPSKTVFCECKKYDIEYIKCLNAGVVTLEKMTDDLNLYYSNHIARSSSSYTLLELAAVRIIFDDKPRFHRVAVMEDLPIDSDEVPEVLCYFVDTGHTRVLNFSLLQVLPTAFCYVPPLAYRCNLSGVTSASAGSDDSLIELVKEKEVLVKIRQKCVLGDVTAVTHTEEIPYGVELYSTDSSGRFTPLSVMLMEKGVAMHRGESPLEEATGVDEPQDLDQEDACHHDENLEFL